MFPSSAFWAEMALAKRWAQERNQRQQKMLRMSNTESSTDAGEALVGPNPPFGFWEGMGALGVAFEEEEGMRSTNMGDNMVVKKEEDGRLLLISPNIANFVYISLL
jgi:hypothetical protein